MQVREADRQFQMKRMRKDIYCHPALFALYAEYRKATGQKNKLRSKLLGENLNNLRYGRKQRKTKALEESEEENEKLA